jgi:predicted DCC family thiol-disulfide oxidoreductase YuxK
MVVVRPDGSLVERGRAVRAVLAAVPFLAWLRFLWALPGVPGLMNTVYDAVARNRHRLGCSEEACGPERRRPR